MLLLRAQDVAITDMVLSRLVRAVLPYVCSAKEHSPSEHWDLIITKRLCQAS